MKLTDALDKKRIIICCGSGGVGKTSVSAALGLLAAQRGRKVIVMTIDPARRLATALGLGMEENAETRIPADVLKSAGVNVSGEFYAMMLNAKKTFDELIMNRGSDEDAKKTLFNNPAYIHGSTALIESPEYMAVEKLHELYHERDYDLIIVDTPPLKHAIDFLTAPSRFHGMLTGNPLIKILAEAAGGGGSGRGGGGIDIFGAGAFIRRLGKAGVFRALALVTGEKAIRDAAEFFGAFRMLMGGFTDRAKTVETIFRSNDCRLFVVTSPNLITIEEALFLKERIDTFGMGFGGFIVNRTEPNYFQGLSSEPDPAALLKELDPGASVEGVAPQLLQVLLENMRRHEMHRRAEEKNVAFLEREANQQQFVHRVPELPSDVHDLKGLSELGVWLEKA